MRKIGASFEFSATDLVGYLNCHHLAAMDRAVAEGALSKPKVWDPLLQVLSERGAAHEQSYIEHLTKAGLDVVRIDGVEVTNAAVAETRVAMQRGTPVIVQAALTHQGWNGRADILRRVEVSSGLGDWSYEPIDTKLARETKAGAVLQLCLYADLLAAMQGLSPEYMYVVAPWSEFRPQPYRFADYAAYFRKVKRALLNAMAVPATGDTYPDPVEHCDICRWREACDKRRHDDDHLSLVAGASKIQINELQMRGVTTVQTLAGMALPLDWKPDRGSTDSYVRIREQARIVVEARTARTGKFELLPVEAGFGLTRLPEPSAGDVFLDLEGDPFVGEHGLEYLLGYLSKDLHGALAYEGDWAFTRVDEKRAFEKFVDFVMIRWAQFPSLHIYHYAPYEPAALKRLMGRYATREEEIDRMLRAGLFVDLYQIVRHSLRASVESYSIKRLEPFYGFEREAPLTDANVALANLQANLELSAAPSIAEDIKAVVRAYNEDDCRSTVALRDWLEAHRAKLVADGIAVPRPQSGDGAPNEKVTDWLIKINALIERLTADVPTDAAERDHEQQARWIMANIVDWHRREEKAVWWEFFRLAALSGEDLLEERAGLSGLVFAGAAGGTAKAPIHRYVFPPQETEIRGSEELFNVGGAKLGWVEAISFADNTVDIKKRQDTANLHPQAAFAHSYVSGKVMAEALVRIGNYVADHGVRGIGPYQGARDLLLRESPRVGDEPLQCTGEATIEAAIRLCGHLAGGVLPIQGPPGAGKTFTGAQMICELARRGKKVGITANSHKVIRNLIDATIKAANELGIDLQCCQKTDEVEDPQPHLFFAKRSEDLFTALSGGGASVGGGTAWLWSRPDAFETVDVLFVDEAAQMSLANVLAVSQAAKTVVLIGDPQQLDQPMQGSHPEGTDVSALDHILGGEHTIPADKGLFLEETWRLHPLICAYTSELFYSGKLRPKSGLEKQVVRGSGPVAGSGLYFLPIAHSGNQNCSPEEAQAVGRLVEAILAGSATWVDREEKGRPVALDDIVIITPYNAQVFEIQQCLPGARVGTVDKFQGQEAPIAIYSMATSSHADAPRGMEFLYSLNRLNVATSRAKGVSILIASPQIFEAECRTPRQIQLANAFCRYLEMAKCI
ncbi:TM0106 family RecB-like putative nuclease [Bradyrhizobium sp. WSM1743]|uniref:TM0106 family RecB-like putative nuclease n=1 Tax=Bradyrhizobium sp. WSM1743 TaxID=318996 RepID=UPI0003F5AD8E|nr:TM0106 family RecB-like putative nuclease [Bradyrhizobium sp. WSM1743]